MTTTNETNLGKTGPARIGLAPPLPSPALTLATAQA
jgi:hypothetical protein